VPVIVFEEILGKETRLLKDFIGASESLVIELSLQILLGLQWIHENGVIIRNLRLDSILVTMTMDNQIQVRIRDLMCAIHTPCLHPSPADNEMLKQSAMFFLAPELYDPLATASLAADVWSLGMIWFILLQRNFSVKEIENIREIGPENFDVQLNSLPHSSLLRHLISDCLKIHPSGRPTCTQLLLQQPFSPFSLRKPPTISSSTDLPNKSIDQESIKEYEAKISIFQEKVLPMKEFYLKYFQFVKALQDMNEFLAEKIFEELRKIDPCGEGKLIYSDEMIFRKEIIDLEIMINELISFYKLNPIDHSRMKSWARIRELRAVLDEIKSTVT
jgi:serine/threonine protein kinase